MATIGEIATIGRVKIAHAELERFRLVVSSQQTKDEATERFKEIGKQFCRDNLYDWPDYPKSVTDETELSPKATKSLYDFLKFVSNNGR